jgi:hypothetical protein
MINEEIADKMQELATLVMTETAEMSQEDLDCYMEAMDELFASQMEAAEMMYFHNEGTAVH